MTANLEFRELALSESTDGDAIEITGTAWNAETHLHIMTQADVIDGVYLRIWNDDTDRALVWVILNPTDDTVQATVDATTVPVWVPARGDVWVLQGDKFWLGAGTYTIAAYLNSSGQSGNVRATGWVTRKYQGDVTA